MDCLLQLLTYLSITLLLFFDVVLVLVVVDLRLQKTLVLLLLLLLLLSLPKDLFCDERVIFIEFVNFH